MCGRFALGLSLEEIAENVRGWLDDAPVSGGAGEEQQQLDHDQENEERDCGGAEPREVDYGDDGEERRGRAGYVRKDEVEGGTRAGNSNNNWVIGEDKFIPRFNVAPTTYSPILRLNPSSSSPSITTTSRNSNNNPPNDHHQIQLIYHLMSWGLIPSYRSTHHSHSPPHSSNPIPDYAHRLKTINARDDMVIGENDGGGIPMWKRLINGKRGVIVCQGFYEWLKKGPNNNERIPYFVKRNDGKLMAFAGLWDSVWFEGEKEPRYTFTIITTSSSKQLSFLHHRMPCILSTPSDLRKWLDVQTFNDWKKDRLGELLKPFEEGELECYQVTKEVNKTTNQSADFIIPVSKRKGNIASMFAKQSQRNQDQSDKQKREREQENIETRTITLSKVPASYKMDSKPIQVGVDLNLHPDLQVVNDDEVDDNKEGKKKEELKMGKDIDEIENEKNKEIDSVKDEEEEKRRKKRKWDDDDYDYDDYDSEGDDDDGDRGRGWCQEKEGGEEPKKNWKEKEIIEINSSSSSDDDEEGQEININKGNTNSSSKKKKKKNNSQKKSSRSRFKKKDKKDKKKKETNNDDNNTPKKAEAAGGGSKSQSQYQSKDKDKEKGNRKLDSFFSKID